MFGFLEFRQTSINSRPFQFGLISRRNRFRAGTRYFSRGIDQNGNVSNFNETEQLVLLDNNTNTSSGGEVRGEVRFSFVQTRGSVPVYWAEINNLRYKPDLKIMDLSSTVCPPLSLSLPTSQSPSFPSTDDRSRTLVCRSIPSLVTFLNKSLSTVPKS
jgi:hypothetical protein